jgi:metal-responsive CopG/Arc/MetJ family transcriptional regulator
MSRTKGAGMPKKKVAVALSDWLLDELDSAAKSAHTSRSALVEEAVADYVVERRKRVNDEQFRERATRALENAKAFAAEVAADPDAQNEPSTLEKLRAMRRGERWPGE